LYTYQSAKIQPQCKSKKTLKHHKQRKNQNYPKTKYSPQTRNPKKRTQNCPKSEFQKPEFDLKEKNLIISKPKIIETKTQVF